MDFHQRQNLVESVAKTPLPPEPHARKSPYRVIHTVPQPCTCCAGVLSAGELQPGMLHNGVLIDKITESTAFGIVLLWWAQGAYAEPDEFVHHVSLPGDE